MKQARSGGHGMGAGGGMDGRQTPGARIDEPVEGRYIQTPQAMLANVRRFDVINQEMQGLLARLAAAPNQTMKIDGRTS